MKQKLQTCAECGSLMMRTPSGAVCSRGCGRIVRAQDRGRLMIDTLIRLGIDQLPKASRSGKGKSARYRIAGDRVTYVRLAAWPGRSVSVIRDLINGGCRVAIGDGRVLVLERERERERDEDQRENVAS